MTHLDALVELTKASNELMVELGNTPVKINIAKKFMKALADANESLKYFNLPRPDLKGNDE
jgi:hypothetical protein